MSEVSTVTEDLSGRQTQQGRGSKASACWKSELLTRLSQWFATDFYLVDGATGDLVHCIADRAPGDWDVRSELCRAIAFRGRAEIIEEHEPLVMMAIPIQTDEQCVVAVGSFVTGNTAHEEQLHRAAASLGLEPESARGWIARQDRWKPEALVRMGQLATDQIASASRLKLLEREVKDLSSHLSATYEEISLLYRLTQNLKLSAKDEELGEVALEWLAEVLPSESLAIMLTPSSKSASMQPDARQEPVYLTHGPCPIDADQLLHMVDHFGVTAGQRPLIVNQPMTLASAWPWPAVRELILVPLCEGENCFGWLVAFNHEKGAEFGTVEASLLNSVGAILGIHCGNTELYHQQREFFAGVVQALTSAIDAKDPYTCGHSDRVARVAVRLAEEMGCDQKQIDTIYLSGLLHDVGKIGIDDNVLRKPGKLTEAEYEHIKTHAEIGHRILSDIKQLDEVLPVVLHHHEQWDGKGYPHGLAGEQIPFLARIVSVADSFDAMGSDRPYRQGLCDEKLDSIMRDGAGKQWDAEVVDAFFRIREAIREIAQQKVKSVSLELAEMI